MPAELREQYFDAEGDRFVFDKDLRRSVIFGRHDLIQDAPISRVNLLVCRNTLMYFNSEAQARILARFHFALSDDGFLFLGKAEMLLDPAALFAPVDLRRRDLPQGRRRTTGATGGHHDAGERRRRRRTAADHQSVVRGRAFDAGPHAQLVIDSDGVARACQRARAHRCSASPPSDVGRPFQELELSYRPVELRSLIEQALSERRPLSLSEVEWAGAGRATADFDVQVAPLLDDGGRRSA